MGRQWPLPKNSFTISSRFAGRVNPVTGLPENHSGTDFAAPDGTPFYACAGGTVQFIGAATGYGQWIVIDHPDNEGGGCSEYGHMWNAYATGLKVGDWVNAGQLIGYIGSNGQSTGPHLHLTVWERGYGGKRIDPETWLDGKPYPGENKLGGGKVGTIFGVDVSEHQNGMSLKRAANEGIKFAIIRTTDGTYKDKVYRSHLDDAESAGLVTAAYHYLRNPSEGTTIAQQVQASLQVMGDAKRPMWLDCETNAGLSAAHIREFKQRFEDAGVRVVGAYSYVPWWEGKTIGGEPDSHEFGAFWVAAYGQNPSGVPTVIYPGDNAAQWNYPLGNQKPVLWQFGSNASVAGYSVDINAYKGTVEQLRALFYGDTAATNEEDTLSAQAEKRIELTLDQLVGPKKKADGTPDFSGWPQLGGKTLVDFLVALDKKVDAIAAAQKEGN